MGTLVPEDFPLEQLADDAERSVVEAMRDGLSSNWHIVPDIGMRDEIDRQTDIVLVHPEMGVVLLEVKSHQMSIREGQWYGELGTPLQKSPIKQAKDNAYELRKRLRHEIDGLEQIRVDYGIALPNTRELVGALPPDIKPVQVLTSLELADVNDAIEDLVFERSWNRSFTPEQFEAIISMLRPDVDFAWDPDARATTTRDRLLEMCDTQIAVARSLAMNRRVCVRGGAGTGKTRLAMAVAQDAWHEGDHVLVTCYNDPLALALREALPVDEDLVIGAFFRVALALPGMPHLEIPADANQNWWDTVATGHLHTHWPNIAERFDTIIIDEAQDLSVAWLAQLESLLAPEGKRRIFMVADEDQGLYERGFRFPDADDGWTHAELVYNCRNAQPIARILRHRLGGPAAPSAAPMGLPVQFVASDDIDVVTGQVQRQLARIIDDEGRDPHSIGVGTFRTTVRNHLREALDLVPTEDWFGDEIICENVHRLKGLEFDTVILAAIDDDIDEKVLYVGVSRAVSELIVIGPRALGERLGLV